MQHEQRVREFYEHAGPCFESVMGDVWHFGDPEAERRGLSIRDAALLLDERVLAATGLSQGGWALDFGSGVGGATVHMAKVSGARFVGVTNNDALNQRSRALAAAMGVADRVSFLTVGDTDYRNLPFPTGSFDAAFFFESVCHLSDKAGFFREMFRVLRPGATLAGTDWLQRAYGERQSPEAIAEFMDAVDELYCIPGHGTIESHRAMAEAAGFEVTTAVDLYDGVLCWGSAPPEHHEGFTQYAGIEHDAHRSGKAALDAARNAGVFTVGMIVARKPA